MARLRRTGPLQPGLTRRRRGRGWQYRDADGAPVDRATRERVDGLVIPPAWTDVWICPWPNGHLQAVGTDAAGRRQYLYHPEWSARRHQLKFQRVIGFGTALPLARPLVDEHLAERGMSRERALAIAFRLLDRGHFRIGGEVYAQTNGSFGLATLRREHVRRERGHLVFSYTAKAGLHREERLHDPALLDSIGTLLRRRDVEIPELLAYRDGRGWRRLGSSEINAYLKEVTRQDVSAKDFRTWHGTVLASVALAQLAGDPSAARSRTATTRAVRQAVVAVSDLLGNTPAVCRASYIDPRVLESFERGRTIARPVSRALRELADDLPPLDDQQAVGDVLARVAATPGVERAVLALLREGGRR